MFHDISIIVQADIESHKKSHAELEDYVAMRLNKSLAQYTKDLDQSVTALSSRNNINVLYRYSED